MAKKPRLYFSINVVDLLDIGMEDGMFGDSETLEREFGGNFVLPVGTYCLFDEIDGVVGNINYRDYDNSVTMEIKIENKKFHSMMFASLKDPKNGWKPRR